MTTSTLKTFTPGGLYGSDVQALKDFALEAPVEWRHAFEELLDVYEKVEKLTQEAEDAKATEHLTAEALKELQRDVKTAAHKMLHYVERLEAGRRNGDLTKGDLDIITQGVRAAFEQLVDASG